MICPICDTNLSFKKNKCDRCGEDLKIYKKAFSVSNKCYNEGLMKAKVRDLSGAAAALKKSLHFNKRNTNARNLLGLVYLEMGETVSALSEWVISKHFQPEENDADDYINELQSNPSKLESMNQTIKKYNLALQSAKQGNEDLAVIQLKKVTSLNPKFLRAQQLLALLYMEAGERDKALKCLYKARKIDVNNTITLRYLNELETTEHDRSMKKAMEEEKERPKRKKDETVSIMPVSNYKEDKPNILAWCNLVIGALIGIAVVYYLMVPTIEKRIVSKYQSDVVAHNEELSGKDSEIAALENDKKELAAQVEELTKENNGLKESVQDEKVYDNLFLAARKYIAGDPVDAAETLMKVKSDKLERKEAQNLYKSLKSKTYAKASQSLYDQGYTLYSAYKYKEALPYFQKAVKVKADNCEALYFLGRTYHRLGDKKKSAECYNKIINDYPDDKRVSKAKQQLRSLGL